MSSDFILDTHVLQLDTLEWCQVLWRGPRLPGVYNFAAGKDGDKIYIFGGTLENYS